MGSYALAFLAGMVTILSPCVLPLLPLVVGGSSVAHKYGPLALVAGLVLSFTCFGFFVVTIGHGLGLTQLLLQQIAAWILLVFGLILLVKPLFGLFAATLSGVMGGVNSRMAVIEGNGIRGQFGLGAVLGLVWSPCVGPTLGAAIALAAQGKDLLFAFTVMLTFAIGTAVPVLALALVSGKVMMQRRQAMGRLAVYLKPVTGLLFMGVGLLFLTGGIVWVENGLLDILPLWLTDFIYSL